MSKKIISFSLSEQEITKAIKDLASYKLELLKKVDIFRERVAERIANEAQIGFNGAVVDDIINGGQKLAKVDVTFNDRDSITVVIAKGADAIWVEFGAGVYHNGTAGSSPHPKGQELGMTIGGYGKGFGERRVWGYKNKDDDTITLTHGTPAKMPMERALLTICNEISQIAREVFA